MKAKAWVVVQATRATYGRRKDGTYPVSKIRMTKMTAGMPVLEVDQEAIEIEIDLPDDYFDSNRPKIEVQIPPSTAPTVIQTTAKVTKGRAPSAAAAVIQP